MFRSILGLILLCFSALSFAGSCSVSFSGPFDSSASAYNACISNSGAGCGYSGALSAYGWAEIYREYDGAPLHSYQTVRTDCAGTNTAGYNTTYHTFTYTAGCPAGTTSVAGSGGYCACNNGGSYNFNTGICLEPPPGPDEFPGDTENDTSDNTGGTENDFGGEPGAECNFSPEGCSPWDKESDPPGIDDIQAPDATADAPPDAVTTDSKTETNSDGSSTTTSSREWLESDGSRVRETTKTTTNPDGSTTTEKTVERQSPDGSYSKTTLNQETDAQGNTTVTGTSEEKKTEQDTHASGGNTCDVAPSCDGDPVGCAILNQQWLTRCDKNTEYSDSDCGAQPQCSGDVLLCAGLINEWQNRCQFNKSPADAEDFFEERGFQTAEDYDSQGGIFGDGESVSLTGVASGVFESRSAVVGSCPADTSYNLGLVGDYSFSYQPICDAASMLYWVVMFCAYVAASFIIFRAVNSPL